MEDSRIIELLKQREETVISALTEKYHNYCTYIAHNILKNREDVEECVNDTWLKAWDSIPPQEPSNLRVYLGCIIRNLSINRYNQKKAKKRYADVEFMLSELEDCIPHSHTVESQWENKRIGKIISNWLEEQEEESRNLFIQRYWYSVAIKELAQMHGCTPNAMTSRLKRLREQLKDYLDREDVFL